MLRNNTAENRFEWRQDGLEANLFYTPSPGVCDLTETEVPKEASGKGVGSRLVEYALDYCREHGLKAIPTCPFVSGFIARHPEYKDVVR